MAASDKLTTKESYEKTAGQFAENVADLAPLASIERFVGLMPAKGKMIELGCGSGRDAKIFSEKGLQVVGIDFCANLLEIAKKNAPLASFQLVDFEEMDFPPDTFDGAWACTSLLHLPKEKMASVLQSIHTFLKKDGIFYISLKAGEGEVLEADQRYGNFPKFWSYYQEDEIRAMLESAGFKIIDLTFAQKTHPYQSHSGYRAFCKAIKG